MLIMRVQQHLPTRRSISSPQPSIITFRGYKQSSALARPDCKTPGTSAKACLSEIQLFLLVLLTKFPLLLFLGPTRYDFLLGLQFGIEIGKQLAAAFQPVILPCKSL